MTEREDALLHAAIDGELTRDERVELEHLLARSDEARRRLEGGLSKTAPFPNTWYQPPLLPESRQTPRDVMGHERKFRGSPGALRIWSQTP